jgi:TP901 family phage tail tape measure protein
MSLLETVGARLVLLGQREYIAGLAEAKKSIVDLGGASKVAAAGSKELQAATDKATAAQKTFADAARRAAAAQRELEAAERSVIRTEAEQSALDNKTTAAAAAKAKARRDAAAAAKVDADAAAAAAARDAAAAKTDADAVVAAEARKTAARDAGLKLLKVGVLGVAAATAVVGVGSVKMATDFQTQMTRLYTAAGAPKQAILDNAQAIIKIGNDVGFSGAKMAEALYHPISAGLDLATSLNVVRESAKEAQISGATLDDTTYSLSSVMKAFNQPAGMAGKTMAELNAIVGEGDMRFQDFNDSIKNWAPTAAQMGLSVTSMGAGIAYLTDRGNDATTAATRLTMGLSMMTTPSAQAAKLLESLGVASSDVTASSDAMKEALQKAHVTQNQLAKDLQQPDGLYIALHHLKTALEQNGVAGTEADSVLGKIFGGGRSDKAILSLMQNLDGLHEKFIQISDKSTTQAFEQNWEDAQKTFSFQVKALGADLENVGIKIGTALLPGLTSLVTGIRNTIKFFQDHKAAAEAVAWVLGTLLVVAIEALTVAMSGKLIKAIMAVGRALLAVTLENPILLVITLIAMGALFIITHWEQVKTFFIGLWNGIVSVARAAWDWIVKVVSGAASAIAKFFQPVTDAIVGAWNWIKNAAATAWNWILGIVKFVVGGIIRFFQPLVDAIRSHWDEIRQVTAVVWAIISGLIKIVWIGIKAVVEFGIKIVTDLVLFGWTMISGAARIAWAVISGVIEGAWNIIKDVVGLGVAFIWGILQNAWIVIRTGVEIAWAVILTILRVAWDAIVFVFDLARDIVIGIITVFLDIITGNWGRAWTDIKNFLVNIWNDIWGFLRSIGEDIWHGLEDIFTSAWHGIVDIFTNLWNNLKNIFVKGANVVIDVVNGFLGIVNKVAGAVGFSINLHIDKIPEMEEGGVIPVRLMAAGGSLGDLFSEVGAGFITNGPRAIVGEGNPNHPEFVIPTDPAYRGRALGLLADLMATMGVGPGFATGGELPAGGGVQMLGIGGVLGDIWGGITNVASTVGGAVVHGFDAAFDWVGSIARDGARKVIEGIWPKLDVPENSFAGFVPATLNSWRDKALSWVEGKYNESQQAKQAQGGNWGPALTGAGGTAAVHAWVMTALALMGMGPEFAPGIESLIMHESGGNPNAINLWDSNAKAGHPSQGLMQTIPGTFHAYVLPSLADRPITDPVANITAGVRYALANYGPGMLLAGGRHTAGGAYMGYAAGGLLPLLAEARASGGPVTPDSPYIVGERGPELFVPSGPGTVVAADLTADLLGGGSPRPDGPGLGGTTVVVEAGAFTVYESGDPRRTYEAAMRGMADAVARR